MRWVVLCWGYLFAQEHALLWGQAQAGSAAKGSLYAPVQNPAAMFQTLKPQFSATFTKPYMLAITAFTFNATLPFLKQHYLGTYLYHYGFENYQEINASFSYAYAFKNQWSLALKAIYLYQSTGEPYTPFQQIALEAGTLLQLTPQWDIAVWATNINGALDQNNQLLPVRYILGLHHQPNPKTHLYLDIEKSLRLPLAVRSALYYNVYKTVSITVGMGNVPQRFALGMELRYEALLFHWAIQYHPQLQWTPVISLSFNPEYAKQAAATAVSD